MKNTRTLVKPTGSETWFENASKKFDVFFELAIQVSIKIGFALGSLLGAIIIAGIGINIAAEFWPNLKTEIPSIYGFFNGLLVGVEWLFEKAINLLKKN